MLGEEDALGAAVEEVDAARLAVLFAVVVAAEPDPEMLLDKSAPASPPGVVFPESGECLIWGPAEEEEEAAGVVETFRDVLEEEDGGGGGGDEGPGPGLPTRCFLLFRIPVAEAAVAAFTEEVWDWDWD